MIERMVLEDFTIQAFADMLSFSDRADILLAGFRSYVPPLANGRPPLTRRLKRDALRGRAAGRGRRQRDHRPSTVNQNNHFWKDISMMGGTVLPIIPAPAATRLMRGYSTDSHAS
jgi:hypothetical protein